MVSIYDVTDAAYGAVGNGSDSSAATNVTAINDAIDDANAAGGGMVVVPASTASYKVRTEPGSNIRLKSRVILFIEPGATVEGVPNAVPEYQVVSAQDVTDIAIIGGGTIKGDRPTHTPDTDPPPPPDELGMCVQLKGVDRALIENLTILDGWGDGIYIGRSPNLTCHDVHVRRCHVHHNRRNNITVDACDRGTVVWCHLNNAAGTSPQAGIDLEPTTNYGEVQNFTVSHNWIDNCAGPGISVTWSEFCTISANYLVDNGSHGLTLFAARFCVVESNLALRSGQEGFVLISDEATHQTSHHIIRGNHAYSNTGSGFRFLVQATSYDLDDVLVESNIADGNGDAGFFFTDVRNFVVSNNRAINNGDDGIVFTGSKGVEHVVQGNIVKTNQSGIALLDQKYCMVGGNIIRQNRGHGILLSASSHNQVSDNTIVSNCTSVGTFDQIHITGDSDRNNTQGNTIRDQGLTNRPRYGIRINGPSADGNVVTNNHVQSGATGTISDAGTGTVTAAGNVTF